MPQMTHYTRSDKASASWRIQILTHGDVVAQDLEPEVYKMLEMFQNSWKINKSGCTVINKNLCIHKMTEICLGKNH